MALIAAGVLTAAVPASAPASNPLPITANKPPGLLAALHKTLGTAVPFTELAFTYETDPQDAHWVFWLVLPAPGYQDKVQGAAGFAHSSAGKWQIWGPGTTMVGCTAQGSLPPVPAAVIRALGQSCGSTVPAATTTTAPAAKAAAPVRYDGPTVIKFYDGHKSSVSLAGDFIVGPGHRFTGHQFTGPRICSGALPLTSGYFHWQQPRVGRAGGLVGCTIVYTGHPYPIPTTLAAGLADLTPRVWHSNPRVIYVYSSIRGGTLLARPFIIRLALVGKPPSNNATLTITGTASHAGAVVHLVGSSSPKITVNPDGSIRGSASMQWSVTLGGAPAGCTLGGGFRATSHYSWSGRLLDSRTGKAQLLLTGGAGTVSGSATVHCNLNGQSISRTVPVNTTTPGVGGGKVVIVYLNDRKPQTWPLGGGLATATLVLH